MSRTTPREPGPESELLPVDERLVAPESRYEIEDGKVVYVPPADPPHATAHIRLGFVANAHVAEGYVVAADMLTRVTRIDDIAPDVSIYPVAADPVTGGRQIEELAFEITSTQGLGHVGTRAGKLRRRGVRRVFALDTRSERVLEWSTELASWIVLPPDGSIEDVVFVAPVPLRAFVDDDTARAASLRALEIRAARRPRP